jgi:uncharacterized membrane protein YhfC
MIPIMSIILMAVSAALCFGAPTALFVYWHKRYKMSGLPLAVGMAAFYLFVLVLERLLHGAVLKPDASGAIQLMESPVLFMLYGGLMAGIFEETARFISFKLLKKKYSGIGTALSYGIGHGGIEALLLAGLPMVNYVVFGVMANIGVAIPGLPAATAGQIDAALEAIAAASPHMLLVSGVERVMALTVQIALSVFVWYAATNGKKLWLYPAAIALHALVDFPAALYQAGAITNIFAVELFVLAAAVVLGFAALKYHQRAAALEAAVTANVASADAAADDTATIDAAQ